MKFLLRWLGLTLSILAATYLLKGIVVADPWAAVWAALALGLINVFVRPVLILLTLPLTLISLGLFLLILNAFLLYAVQWFVNGFFVINFWWALVGSLFISIVNAILNRLLQPEKERRQ